MVSDFILLIISLGVCAGYGIPGLICILAEILLSWILGFFLKGRKLLLWCGIAVFGGALILLRLEPVTGLGLMAPLGISYYTLKLISYDTDVCRGKCEPEKNLLEYAVYAAYLPELFLGPINRYDASRRGCHITPEGLKEGLFRALIGLFKKLVIAARAGAAVSAISGQPQDYGGAYALFAMLLYSVQLYADFSGGIDIVLGISRMLGRTVTENFERPYFSETIQEFWRRWHITLGQWLKDYIYIPLGGSRKGRFRKYVNTLITFLVSGLWHGLNYMLWGLLNGIFVCTGNGLKTRFKHLNRAVTFLLVSLMWAFFIWEEPGMALGKIASVFTTFNYAAAMSSLTTLGLSGVQWIILAAGTAMLLLYDIYGKKLWAKVSKLSPAGITAAVCALALLIMTFGFYGIGFDAEAFIYSRF